MSYEEYTEKVYLENSFFNRLTDAGYRMGIYTPELIPLSECFKDFENVLDNQSGVTSYWDFARWNIQMAGFRSAPYELKRFCFVNPKALETLINPPEEANPYDNGNDVFLDKIKSEDIVYSNEKCFRFIHIEGAHLPFVWDKDMNPIPESKGTYEQNYGSDRKPRRIL